MRQSIGALVVAVAVGIAGCGGTNGSPVPKDPAARLAKADRSTDVTAYRSALDKWQLKCTKDRATVAGYVDATYRHEHEHHGPDKSRLLVMRHLAMSVRARTAPADCARVAAAYLARVEK